MIKLDIKTNGRDVMAKIKKFASDLEIKATVRALNKTAEQARTEASVQVRTAGFNIKASAIKKSFTIQKASAGRLLVVLKSTGAPIGLINYGARQTKSGVSVQVKGARTILRHAFIRTMGNGHKGVYERVGAARTKGAKQMVNGRMVRANLPVRELFGPSIPSALANEVVQNAIIAKMKQAFPKILEHEISFLMKKK